MDNWKIWLGLLGGIGGAIISFLTGRLVAYRARPILLVRKRSHEFALPFGSVRNVKVSFNGTEYERLGYGEFLLANIGHKTVPAGLFHVTLAPSNHLVEAYTMSYPENLRRRIAREDALPAHKLVAEFGELRPGDSIQYGLLVSGNADFAQEYRGDPEVRLVPWDVPFGTAPRKRARSAKILLVALLVVAFLLAREVLDNIRRGTSPFGVTVDALILLGAALALAYGMADAFKTIWLHRKSETFLPMIARAAPRVEALLGGQTSPDAPQTGAVKQSVAPEERSPSSSARRPAP